jgi:hypothetical protein
MARYIADSNNVGFFYESGTYANVSGTVQSFGLVQEHSVTSNMNTSPIRFVGNASRDVGQQINIMEDYEGTLSYYPQDWKGVMFALGSVVDGGIDPFTHEIKALDSTDGNQFTSGTLNPFISFSIEDGQQSSTADKDFVRTVNGCIVNSFTVTASQGEPISCELSYLAQNVIQTSGAPNAVTESTLRPFLFDDLIVAKNGTNLNTVRDFSLAINNNLDAPHYINGSKVVSVPIPGNRDYEVSLTIDANEVDTIPLYEENLKGGSEFNMTATFTDVSAGAGSRDATFTLSGCKLTSMENPTTLEGVNEQSITIVPKKVTGLVNDIIGVYGGW